jgi:dolichyl-phosphate beta-glucosyltransferase
MFNEEDRIAESLLPLTDFLTRYPPGSELLLVDDGSSDRTPDVVEDFLCNGAFGDSVRLLRAPHQGKGGAVRVGLGEAVGEYAGFCDVDLATPLDELQRLLALATLGPALVIASRDVFTTDLIVRESGGRELMGKCFNLLVRTTLTPGIYDTQCGAKVAATAVWRQILAHSRENGFVWDVETVAIARRLSFPVWEVGVHWRHDPRSRVRPWRDGAAMVRAVPRIWQRVGNIRTVERSEELLSDLGVTPESQPAWS